MSKPLVISAITALILVWSGLFVWPKYQDFKILKVELQNKKDELSVREQYLADLELLSAKLENYPEELKRINLAVPDRPNAAHIFDWLQAASSANGLVLKHFGFSAASSLLKKPEIRATGINLELSGTYPALLSFLAEIEKSARLFELSSLIFFSPEKGDIFPFEISLKVHSF